MVQACATYKNHRFPIEIVAHAVWLYYRFGLSLYPVSSGRTTNVVRGAYQTCNDIGSQHWRTSSSQRRFSATVR
ncbi:putative transposase [Sinorhizobium meliloti]|nr:putative transposase [Sinorhizobium meliloti]TWA35486.1 hypothetical protein FB007_106337 [Sinorhizobium medicae]